jgi:hypothetical protein
MYRNGGCAVFWSSHAQPSVGNTSSGLTKRHYGNRSCHRMRIWAPRVSTDHGAPEARWMACESQAG